MNEDAIRRKMGNVTERELMTMEYLVDGEWVKWKEGIVGDDVRWVEAEVEIIDVVDVQQHVEETHAKKKEESKKEESKTEDVNLDF